jgi:hypothetical protein
LPPSGKKEKSDDVARSSDEIKTMTRRSALGSFLCLYSDDNVLASYKLDDTGNPPNRQGINLALIDRWRRAGWKS